ncbi:unnamed protein product [Withania somnifera]
MGPSKLSKVIGAVKDQTSISLAKVGSSASLSDLEVAIVKATRHDEYPQEERHKREILNLTFYPRGYVGACVSFLSRRLSKAKNWIVALKALMLIHRLLCDGDSSYEEEIFFVTRQGTRLLNMSDFRDSRSNSWDGSAFVRSYALYLDEHLEFRMQSRRGKLSAFAYNDDEEEVSQSHNARGNDRVFSRIHHLMQLLERFLACRPAGPAKNNQVVTVALHLLVKESFQLYYDLTEITILLFDKFTELSIPDSVKVLEIFFRINKQYEEIQQFYDWGKTGGVTRNPGYPEIEIIPPKKLERMDDLIREKSFREQTRKAMRNEPPTEHVQETKGQEPKTEPEEDMNAIKALPAPEGLPEETEERTEEEAKKEVKTQEVGDLLNLSEDVPTSEEHGDQLALALFDSGQAMAIPATSISPWQAFNDSGDRETALVQSASHLSNQKPSLPGGFDTSMLNGMYQQGAVAQAVACSGVVATGSASSVALGSAGRPAMLAFPAPPTAKGGANTAPPGTDPFAASLAIAPPAYVQMSEMEKKQRLLMEEQLMWQEYQKNVMQGHVGFAKAQANPYPYNIGGYRQTF